MSKRFSVYAWVHSHPLVSNSSFFFQVPSKTYRSPLIKLSWLPNPTFPSSIFLDLCSPGRSRRVDRIPIFGTCIRRHYVGKGLHPYGRGDEKNAISSTPSGLPVCGAKWAGRLVGVMLDRGIVPHVVHIDDSKAYDLCMCCVSVFAQPRGCPCSTAQLCSHHMWAPRASPEWVRTFSTFSGALFTCPLRFYFPYMWTPRHAGLPPFVHRCCVLCAHLLLATAWPAF